MGKNNIEKKLFSGKEAGGGVVISAWIKSQKAGKEIPAAQRDFAS